MQLISYNVITSAKGKYNKRGRGACPRTSGPVVTLQPNVNSLRISWILHLVGSHVNFSYLEKCRPLLWPSALYGARGQLDCAQGR